MKIGIVKEIKNQEYRVSMTPEHVRQLALLGHQVNVELNAGSGSGFSDDDYREAGAQITDAQHAWESELVVKVKEPMPSEYDYLQGQMVFTFLHLAGVDPQLTDRLLCSKTTALAYETLEDDAGRLPLLAPMSAIAGNMAAQMGSYYLARFNGGKGVQLGCIMGARHGKVLVIGDGVVGQHAAAVASGLGAEVVIAGLFPERLADLRQRIAPDIGFIQSSAESIAAEMTEADLVVGAVLSRGSKAPYVVSEAMVKSMQPGSVVVDVSIDQGGCVQTSRPTSHDDPIFVEHGVIHYCVTNMPGAFPRTATLALTEATWAYIELLANKGVVGISGSRQLRTALNCHDGYLCNRPAAESLELLDRYRAPDTVSFNN
ncbi:MAG: alanine dehydrogenase [Gammaproteobacteria bacterium]|nr:alanine dehydrogenase [Gammaproteobacteria bacterium]